MAFSFRSTKITVFLSLAVMIDVTTMTIIDISNQEKMYVSTGARVSFDSEKQSNEPDYWAFQKFALPNKRVTSDTGKNCLEFAGLEFGPFGASNVSIGVKPLTPLSLFKKEIRIYYDGKEKKTIFPVYVEAITVNQENIVTFGVKVPNGQYDTSICFPENVALDDIKSVQFYTGDPEPGQLYYLLNQFSGKALTLANNPEGGNFTTNYFREFLTQQFKFDKVRDVAPKGGCGGRHSAVYGDDEYSHWDGGYQIVSAKNEKVLTVKDSSSGNDVLIMAQSFTGVANQVWYIQEYQGGFRFRPTFLTSKCLDLIGYVNKEGARVVDYTCSSDVDVSMIWLVVKVC